MSILKNKKQGTEEEVYFNFINSIKAEATKKDYERDIKLFMKFCDATRLSDLLVITEPQKQIIKYLMSQRARGLAFNTLSNMLNAIYHFYEMNDVVLNKSKINMFKGEFTKTVTDRAYNHNEIRKVLDVSDVRLKVMILLMAPSGMRVGALPLLRLRNLEKIDSIYKITVYEGANEEYHTVKK